MTANLSVARQLLAAALQVPVESLAADAAVGGMEAWDSLAHVRVMTAIEEAIGRALTSDEIVSIASLSDIVTLLDRVAA